MSVAILQYIFQGGGGRKASVCAPPPTPTHTHTHIFPISQHRPGKTVARYSTRRSLGLNSSPHLRDVRYSYVVRKVCHSKITNTNSIVTKTRTQTPTQVRELNRQRSLQKEVVKPERFEILIRLLFLFLDQSLESRDVKAVNMMMIMSQTFYRRKSTITDEDREKIESERDERKREVATRDFLQPYIARHRVWKELVSGGSLFGLSS